MSELPEAYKHLVESLVKKVGEIVDDVQRDVELRLTKAEKQFAEKSAALEIATKDLQLLMAKTDAAMRSKGFFR